MSISLSEPGYDLRTGIYTSSDAPEIDDTLSVTEAAEAWRSLMSEFCFPKSEPDECGREPERERCISVALAAALTPFCALLLPEEAHRPAFLAAANAEGAGKTLLLSFGMIAKLGFVPTGAAPEKEEEMRKVLDAAVHHGVPIIFFDNLRGYLNSGELAAFITSTTRTYRLLGSTNYNEADNLATVYITGNFATFAPDMRRRLLAVELILEESKAEDRIIKNVLNEEKLIQMRPKLLSIFWAMVKAWDRNGQPSGKIILASFEQWSRVVGGIVERAGFVSPCSPVILKTGGDTQTRDMEALIDAMDPTRDYKFNELVELAADEHLFSWLIPPTGTMGRSESTKLGIIFRRAVGRIFNRRYQFFLRPGTWRTEGYYVVDLQPQA